MSYGQRRARRCHGAYLDAILDSLYRQKFSGVSMRKGIQPVTAVGSPIDSIGVFSASMEWTTTSVIETKPAGNGDASIRLSAHPCRISGAHATLRQPTASRPPPTYERTASNADR
ncbi:hypothetical protein OUZ56_011697 [Daphnia magna]|uniref:Uncharacterized protein n=1 Tax=Daphnia magna TaxID=35525 RepID=A0ABQ9Z0W1_9CRUS|nr:hypothetical protein OUZ56_011697 [Daphnia magna]